MIRQDLPDDVVARLRQALEAADSLSDQLTSTEMAERASVRFILPVREVVEWLRLIMYEIQEEDERQEIIASAWRNAGNKGGERSGARKRKEADEWRIPAEDALTAVIRAGEIQTIKAQAAFLSDWLIDHGHDTKGDGTLLEFVKRVRKKLKDNA